jgi:hypothetical protein
MTGLLNATTDLLASVVMLILAMAIVPFLLKIFMPVIGETVWRGYWGLVKWTLLIPFRLLAFILRQADRRR